MWTLAKLLLCLKKAQVMVYKYKKVGINQAAPPPQKAPAPVMVCCPEGCY